MNLSEIKDQSVAAEIEHALTMRVRAKELEDEAKIIKEESNDLLKLYMAQVGTEAVEMDNVGAAKICTSNRSRLDKDKLALDLVKAGMPAVKVTRIITDCTTYTRSESVRFTKCPD